MVSPLDTFIGFCVGALFAYTYRHEIYFTINKYFKKND